MLGRGGESPHVVGRRAQRRVGSRGRGGGRRGRVPRRVRTPRRRGAPPQRARRLCAHTRQSFPFESEYQTNIVFIIEFRFLYLNLTTRLA